MLSLQIDSDNNAIRLFDINNTPHIFCDILAQFMGITITIFF